MSAQAGILYFDGRPIGPDIPARLSARLAAFGPEGRGEYTVPGLVMVHRALHVTPEDRLEHQPHVSARGNVMTWDGRLDNRADLLLQLWRELRDDTTDVAIAMAAYEKWGDSAFARLVGDWSLVVFSAADRRVLIASDYAGVRPMYVREHVDRLEWSSTLSALVDPAAGGDELCEPFLVGFVTAAIPRNATPYEHVRTTSPGHIDTWTTNGRSSCVEYWQPGRMQQSAASIDDYAGELRRLLAEAISARLRSTRRVWAELSGGLDSSSVVCIAHALARGASGLAPIQTISYISDRARESDERVFIDAVESCIGSTGVRIVAEQVAELEDPSYEWTTPLHPQNVALAFLERVASSGSRVVLSGSLGDLTMANVADHAIDVVEWLRRGRVGGAFKRLRAWSLATHSTIWEQVGDIVQALRRPSHQTIRQIHAELDRAGVPAGADVEMRAAAFYLLTRKAANTWWQETVRARPRTWNAETALNRDMLRGVQDWCARRILQTPSDYPRVMRTFPFAHRPLVEFVLSVPSHILVAPGKPRALMRAALQDTLPPRILNRFSKGYAAPLSLRLLSHKLPVLFGDVRRAELVQRGIVSPELLQQALDDVRNRRCRSAGNLYPIARLEHWLAARKRLTTVRARLSA
jgi:asparagine synthase (glutamine-hydrolysing)